MILISISIISFIIQSFIIILITILKQYKQCIIRINNNNSNIIYWIIFLMTTLIMMLIMMTTTKMTSGYLYSVTQFPFAMWGAAVDNNSYEWLLKPKNESE